MSTVSDGRNQLRSGVREPVESRQPSEDHGGPTVVLFAIGDLIAVANAKLSVADCGFAAK